MAFSSYDICSKNLTKSHRHPYGIRSGGGRNPIGRRTESDWTANGIRLDGVRKRWEKLKKKSATPAVQALRIKDYFIVLL